MSGNRCSCTRRSFPLFSFSIAPRRLSFLNNVAVCVLPVYINLNLKHKPTALFATEKSDASSSLNPSLFQLGEAQQIVSEHLQQFGVPHHDAISIASNCPVYLKRLLQGVQEMDELSLLDNQFNDGATMNNPRLSFRDKVMDYLQNQKSGNAKVAFLESIGLTFSSSMNVSWYLSSEALPALIHKVNYLKEVFFSGDEDDVRLAKNARRMMSQLSITADEDLQQTLSFFEKVEAKRGGLNMLGSNKASFKCLLESFPRLLLLSVESNIKPVAEFLGNIGIPRERFRNIVLLFPPLLFLSASIIESRVRALKEIGFEDKDYGKLLLKYPWILCRSVQENYKEVNSLFSLQMVEKSSVDRGIKSWPLLLGCSTNNLNKMVQLLGALGVHNRKLGTVIAKSPQLLLQDPQQFHQVVSFFEDLGFDMEVLGKKLVRCPEIFSASIEDTLKRKIEFLIKIGVSEGSLPRVIKMYPEVLVSDTEKTILPRITYLMNVGLSRKDVIFMVSRFSPLLGYGIEEVLKPKLEFLVRTMKRPVKDVVGYPRYFSYSLEKRIKPRYWVLKGRNVECSLKDMLGKNDEEFADEFMGLERIPASLQQ